MSTALTTPTASQWDNPVMIQTLKDTVCRGASDAQFRMFLEVCKGTGLNPFLKEIYFVPGVGVMAGRDGYLRVANEDPRFDGMETRVERDDKGVPIKAVCTVWRKDRNHPVIAEAYYNEYKKSSSVWSQYPSAMISKIAEVLALKRSFSINGVVTEEEIGEKEPTGSREAQQEVLARKLAALPPKQIAAEVIREMESLPVPPDRVVEIIDEEEAKEKLTAAQDIEQRHAAKQSEAQAAMAPEPKFARQRGTIQFKALEKFAVQKKALKELTGTDEMYYDALKVAGVAHADELSQEHGREVWKALEAIRKRLLGDLQSARIEKERRDTLAKEWERLGTDKFLQCIGANGFSSLQELIDSATPEQEMAVLAELRKL